MIIQWLPSPLLLIQHPTQERGYVSLPNSYFDNIQSKYKSFSISELNKRLNDRFFTSLSLVLTLLSAITYLKGLGLKQLTPYCMSVTFCIMLSVNIASS